MNAWPVIVRELRAESRRPLNTGLRVLTASGIIFVFWVVVAASPGEAGKLGLRLFLTIHCTLLAGILILTPLLAADCLSRERREGTLDLLFLTPLRPVGVIVAKCLVHGLRVGSFMLAALPLMALAFLLGGVTWLDFFSALTFEVCALLLALSGAILVSSACSRAGVATALALACASAFMVLFSFHLCAATLAMLQAANISRADLLFGALFLPTGTMEMGGWSKLMGRLPAPVGPFWHWVLAGSLLGCGLLFAGAILLTAFQLRRSPEGRASEGRRGRSASWWRREWTVRPLADRARRWKLDYNPMIWLTTTTRKHSRFRGGWFYLMALVLTGLIATGLPPNHWVFYGWLSAFVLAALSVQAASSFRSERQDGIIELLLTTPQTARALVWGRVLGLYYRYLPAMLLLSASFWLTHEIDSWLLDKAVHNSFFLLTIWGVFLVQPVIGVNSALRLRYAPVAVVYTVFFAVANVLCYIVLFLMAFTFHRAWSGVDHARLGPVGGFLSTFPEMGLLDLAVIAILQGLLAWRYITLMNRRLSRSLLAGEIR